MSVTVPRHKHLTPTRKGSLSNCFFGAGGGVEPGTAHTALYVTDSILLTTPKLPLMPRTIARRPFVTFA